MIAVIVLVAGGFGLARATQNADHRATNTATTSRLVPTATVDPAATDEPVAAVASAVAPAVVQIETSQGLGSGVVYDSSGHILTAAHVVEADTSGNAQAATGKKVTVRLADGTAHDGKVLGADDASDVAVVQVTGADVTVANLGLDVKLVVGQTAVAVGSPFGLDQTVTAGIVSAIDRPVSTPGGAIDMIQTDAPINPGNSGGPLADRKGRIIGINDQIATSGSTSEQNAGVGFAIPITTAKAVADKIVAGQPVEFSFLGVRTEGSGSGLVGNGAVVVQVESGSPAEAAGLKEGDRVTAVDSTPVRDQVDLAARVRDHQPGDTVKLTVTRDGSQQTIAVTLGSTKSG